jgi:hypothetical protein
MAEEPLDRRILREIRARLKELRAAVDEYDRLHAALRALDAGAGKTRTPARSPRSTSAPTKKRAARGANREKALGVIADRPGVTVAELTASTGIARNVLYSLTRALTEQGHVERVGLPGETFGFRIARTTDAGATADGDGSTAEPAPPKGTRTRRKQAARAAEADTADQPADEAEASSQPAAT